MEFTKTTKKYEAITGVITGNFMESPLHFMEFEKNKNFKKIKRSFPKDVEYY